MQKNISLSSRKLELWFLGIVRFKKIFTLYKFRRFYMKQKYLSDGKILVEFKYRGIEYKEEFAKKEELENFLQNL